MEIKKTRKPTAANFEHLWDKAVELSYHACSVPTQEQIQASWHRMEHLLQKQKETSCR